SMSHKRKHAHPPAPRTLRQPVQSLLASWNTSVKVQMLLSALGLMMLGIVCWIVFFDPPPKADPDSWTGWEARDVLLMFIAFVSPAALEGLVLQLTFHEIQARSGEPVQPIARNLSLVAAQVMAILLAVAVFGLKERGQGWHILGLRPLSTGWLW